MGGWFGHVGRCCRFGHVTLQQPDFRNRFESQHAIHPLDDLRRHMLQLGAIGALDKNGQGASALAATREADRLRDAPPRIDQPHDLRPLFDQRPLRKAETTKRHATDFRQQRADLLSSTATLRWLSRAGCSRASLARWRGFQHHSLLCQKTAMTVEPNQDIARDLLHWYAGNARSLPWRMPPGSSLKADPYQVWIAEVMLQQTTVATAIPRYQRFLERFPDVSALAASPLADVLHEWAGLGYYARARNLHAAAHVIVNCGYFPLSESALRQLPGIGAYTAAAIAAIAGNEATVPLDTNLLRVGARLLAVAKPPSLARQTVRSALAQLIPREAAGDFAQALMDLGATICRPARPACHICPLARHCAAQSSGQPEDFPTPEKKRTRPHRSGTLWWMEHRGEVALVRRPANGLLGGLLGFPGSAWCDQPVLQPPTVPATRPTGLRIHHGFTHFTLALDIWVASPLVPPTELDEQPLIWTPRHKLLNVGLPTLYSKAAMLMLATDNTSCFEAA